MIVQVRGPNFTAGVVFSRAEVATQAAPIIKWMKGWSFHQVVSYCKKRNWSCEVITYED